MDDDVPRGMEEPTVLLREISRNEGHTQVAVFVGRGRGSRGRAGTLTLRTDEWDSMASDFHNSLAVNDLLMRIDCEREPPPDHEPADEFSGGRRRPCPDGGEMVYVGDDEGSLAQGGDYEIWDCTVHGRVYLSMPD